MSAAAASAAATAAGAAGAAGLFGYNRENYMFDAENRWERFTSAREYANQQADMYRADLASLATLTMKKCTIWCIMATLTMALCVALYCAGRLGLHGPSPPAWIMGLWLTNNAAAFAFMALCMFLAMHSGFRASAASAHLRTRKIRVPVPSLQELDDARWFASEFEQQDARDMFRIPYITNNGVPKTDDAVYASDGKSGNASSRSRSAPPGRRPSSWIRQEFETDRAGTTTGETPQIPLEEDTAPEHFRLFTAVQKEYYEYDVYARICIFYGFVHYVQALAYYGLGHINIELRAFWVAYATVFVIAVLQALLLRFDIIPQNPNKKERLPYCQFLGPLAILPAAIAMSLDFQVQFDTNAIAICWILIFVSYGLQLIYSLRMLEVVLPDTAFDAPKERLGATWMPEGWTRVPSSFYHVLYFVAPPEKLQNGQHDLVREVKEGGVGAYDEVCNYDAEEEEETNRPRRKPDPVEGPIFPNSTHVRPWKLVANIVGVLPIAWVFLIMGTVVDVILGEQALVTAPHWSRPPLSRLSLEPHELGTPLGGPLPEGADPYTPEQMAWHEEKRHAMEYNIGRRLQASHHRSKASLSDALESLIAAMPSADKAVAVEADSQKISWPGFFEPKLMACGQQGQVGSDVVALTPRGFGATARMGQSGLSAAEPFRLSGLTSSGPLLGASLGLESGAGLLTVSRDGHLVSCPGQQPASGGTWTCGVGQEGVLPSLPVSDGARLRSATAAWLAGPEDGKRRLHAAYVVDDVPELAGIFVHEAGSWLPLGEVRVPSGQSIRVPLATLSFTEDGDLLMATDEHVVRHGLGDKRQTVTTRLAPTTGENAGLRVLQAACSVPDREGDVALLHLHREPASRAWHPQVASMKL